MHDRVPVSAASSAALAGALALLGACGSVDDTPAQLAPAQPGTLATCEALATTYAAAGLVLESAARVAAGTLTLAGQAVPAHCRVTGRLADRVSAVDGQAYALRFEMRLPEAWSGRYLYQANGGLDGVVATAVGAFGGGPLTHALLQGMAVISSDAGHLPTQNPYFGIDPQARLDYGYQAVAHLTPIAKGLIRAGYGRGPDRSYFAGCSNGGRHALVAVARYADDYDGVLAGAPGWQLPKSAVANIRGAQLYATVASNAADLSTAWTAAERQLVSGAVLARCDALDGLADGLVQDSAACQTRFDLARDVPTCTGARDGNCLTAAQNNVIGQIFAGPTTASGARIYAPFPWDGGHGASGVAQWEFTAPAQRDSGAVGFVFGTPPQARSGFDGTAFVLNTPIDTLVAAINATNAIYTESAMQFMSPPNPADADRLRARGGRVMLYHGLSDAIFSADDTRAWLAALQARYGAGTTADFARYFPVPGMGHCSGGPAADQADFLTPLVAWVEQGQAPDAIPARVRGTGNAGGANAELPAGWSATRGRPLCAFPAVARYKGSGDPESADSFECRP